MNGFGIEVCRTDRGTARYRAGGVERWDAIDEAAQVAADLLAEGRSDYVTVGDGGDHELRLWHEGAGSFGNWRETETGIRWGDWYVDVEIIGIRWQYAPVVDLGSMEDAAILSERAAELAPLVTRMWVGASDGSKELEWNVHES